MVAGTAERGYLISMATRSRAAHRIRGLGIVAALALTCMVVLAVPPRARAFVYWANSNGDSIGRANLDGSWSQNRFIAGTTKAHGIAVDGGHVYWANSGTYSIGRANLDGSEVEPEFIAGLTYPVGVAVDSSHIYWVSYAEGIGRANLEGGEVEPEFIPSPDAGYLALDAAHIYWSRYLFAPGGGPAGAIARANLDGTGVEPEFITGASFPRGIALYGDQIYWTNYYWPPTSRAGGSIGRANLDGSGADQEYIPDVGSPTVLAIARNRLYWGRNFTRLGSALINGTGVQEAFIRTGTEAFGLAVDGRSTPLLFLGAYRQQRRAGRATLVVHAFGAGPVVLRGRGLRTVRRRVPGPSAAKLTLPLRPTAKTMAKLRRTGRAWVRAVVVHSLNHGTAEHRHRRLRLVLGR
jgi:hypothetical protein